MTSFFFKISDQEPDAEGRISEFVMTKDLFDKYTQDQTHFTARLKTIIDKVPYKNERILYKTVYLTFIIGQQFIWNEFCLTKSY